MSDLIAIAYETPAQANAGRQDVLRLGADYLDDVGDAALATIDPNGVIDLDQVINLWSAGQKGAMLRELLVGLLFLHPLLAVLKPQTAQQVSASLTGFGLSEEFVGTLRTMLLPGRAVMFLWLAQHSARDLLAALRPAHQALHHAIDTTRLPVVHSAFMLAHQEAVAQRQTAYSRELSGP